MSLRQSWFISLLSPAHFCENFYHACKWPHFHFSSTWSGLPTPPSIVHHIAFDNIPKQCSFHIHLHTFTFFQALFLFTGPCVLVEIYRCTVSVLSPDSLAHFSKTTKVFKEFPVIARSEQGFFPGFCPDPFLAYAHRKPVTVKTTPEESNNAFLLLTVLT